MKLEDIIGKVITDKAKQIDEVVEFLESIYDDGPPRSYMVPDEDAIKLAISLLKVVVTEVRQR